MCDWLFKQVIIPVFGRLGQCLSFALQTNAVRKRKAYMLFRPQTFYQTYLSVDRSRKNRYQECKGKYLHSAPRASAEGREPLHYSGLKATPLAFQSPLTSRSWREGRTCLLNLAKGAGHAWPSTFLILLQFYLLAGKVHLSCPPLCTITGAGTSVSFNCVPATILRII